MGRLDGYSSALLILLAPFELKWALVMSLGMHRNDLAGKPEYLDRAPTHPIEVEGDINNGAT